MINHTKKTILLALACLLSFASIYSGEFNFKLTTLVNEVGGKETTFANDIEQIVLKADDESALQLSSHALSILGDLKEAKLKPVSIKMSSTPSEVNIDIESLIEKHGFDTPEFKAAFQESMIKYHDTLVAALKNSPVQNSQPSSEKRVISPEKVARYAARFKDIPGFSEKTNEFLVKNTVYNLALTFQVEDEKA